jgi:hypothetical protein
MKSPSTARFPNGASSQKRPKDSESKRKKLRLLKKLIEGTQV